MMSLFSFEAAWLLKSRALTEQTYIDEVEVEEEGIAEMLLDDNSIADTASQCIVVGENTEK